jgi:hypothetical protein
MEYHVIKIEGRELRLFKTIVDHRVEDETREEFLIRRSFVKRQIKDRKKYGIDFKYGN